MTIQVEGWNEDIFKQRLNLPLKICVAVRTSENALQGEGIKQRRNKVQEVMISKIIF